MMTNEEQLTGWIMVLLFMAGAFFVFIGLRNWMYRRRMGDILAPGRDR